MVRGEGELSTVRTASDYSYSASSYAGENYRMVGDAAGKFYCTSSSRFLSYRNFVVAAFIDPFFSSGVHLALTSGLSAAGSIAASIRGDCPESDAAEWHTQRVGVSYTRWALLLCCCLPQPSSSWRPGSSLSSWVHTNKSAHHLKMSSAM
jgi:flavine halogenase